MKPCTCGSDHAGRCPRHEQLDPHQIMKDLHHLHSEAQWEDGVPEWVRYFQKLLPGAGPASSAIERAGLLYVAEYYERRQGFAYYIDREGREWSFDPNVGMFKRYHDHDDEIETWFVYRSPFGGWYVETIRDRGNGSERYSLTRGDSPTAYTAMDEAGRRR